MKCSECGTQLLFVAHDGDDNVTGLMGDYFCPNPNCGDVEELVSDNATLVEDNTRLDKISKEDITTFVNCAKSFSHRLASGQTEPEPNHLEA